MLLKKQAFSSLNYRILKKAKRTYRDPISSCAKMIRNIIRLIIVLCGLLLYLNCHLN